MTITTVGTAAALNTALKSAAAGDTILLAPGTYTGVSASYLHFASDVTITSQSASNPAVITSLTITNSNGLTFRDMDFQVDAAAGDNPFKLGADQDIHFVNLDVHGSLDGNALNDKAAFLVRTSSDVSFENSDFHQLSNAIGHLDNTRLTISGNDFHEISVDGVRGGGSSYVTISDNAFYDFYPATGSHPDAIQFWTTNETTSAHDITITNNSIVRGTGGTAQGIFIGDEVGTLPYLNVKISGNLLSGDAYNGISVGHGQNVTITDNIVWGFSDQTSWIRLNQINGGVVTGNTVNSFLTSSLTNVTMSNNTIVPTATDGGAAALSLWNGGSTPTAPSAPADPTTGGLSLVGGAGADTLTGSAYGDTLNGGGGADQLTGGAGNDLYIVDGSAKIVELAGGGTDTVKATGSFLLYPNVENLELVGSHAYNGQGNDLNNSILGNEISNALGGRAGADTLSGGGGSDTLFGGTGNDVLIGGTGADKFVFARGDGDDVIRDFGLNGEHDLLDISSLLNAGLHPTLTDSTTGVTLSFSNGDSVLLQGVHLASLHATTAGYIF